MSLVRKKETNMNELKTNMNESNTNMNNNIKETFILCGFFSETKTYTNKQ